jgi:serine/threonine-protein kinase
MTPERWKKLDALFHEALELQGEARAAHLAKVCGGDEQLRVEVEKLLAAHERESSFIDSPILAEAAAIKNDGDESPVGRRIGHYQIVNLLGRGGMGEVYLAEDSRLGRKVALKVLPAAFTQHPDRVRRFEREAKAASALNHPNILTIHEIGKVDGVHYIVSEFVEGETLRALIGRGRLGISDAMAIVEQVAGALSVAHEAGIIHRDIKPENVMARPDGLVKVLDFGLAKLTEPSQATIDTNTLGANQSLTEPGQVMGTPRYMSPEQARGVEVDARSDIFSLGVVLYELIAGRPPFVGATPTDVIISIVQQEPEPLPEASRELEQIVAKALCKDREQRYQTASELLAALKGLKQRLESKTKLERAGGVAARRTWPWRKVAIASVVVVLLAIAWLWLAQRKPEAPAPVIAVLPFKNLSAEPESEYFVDGLTDEIIRNLAQIEGLEVRSRTSSFAFKNKQPNLREVGEQLKVNFVVDGSVLRSAEKLRINAQFIRVSDDVPLWSGHFDREPKDVFMIQDEISRSVVNELRLKLGRGKRRYDTNPETYELYLKARSLLGATVIPRPNVIKSADLFEQVIAKDPAFAPAYAGLANAYGAISIFTGPRAPGQPDREAAFARMRPTAERALQLDPLLAEAHAAMGRVYVRDLDWASAEKAFRRAIELNPNLTAAYVHLAYAALCPTGRFEEALQETDKAIRADPLSADPWEPRASAFLYAGRYDEAIESCRRGLALDPENFVVKQLQARALLLKGKADEAIAVLEQAGEQSKGQLGYAYAVTGRRAEAQALAAESANAPRRRAWIYAGLGDKDRVFEALEEMAARQDPGAQLYLVFPEMALLRGDPRLAALRKKFGLQ